MKLENNFFLKFKEKYKLFLVFLLKKTDYKPKLIINYPKIEVCKTQQVTEHPDDWTYSICSTYKSSVQGNGVGQYLSRGRWLSQGKAWKDSVERTLKEVTVEVIL